MKITNNIGPKTDPCGIPERICLIVDNSPSTETLKVLSDKKSSNTGGGQRQKGQSFFRPFENHRGGIGPRIYSMILPHI